METIMGLLGIDQKEIEAQTSELFAQFRIMCEYSEESREMLLFLVENLTIEQREKLQCRLITIEEKYRK